MYTDKDGGEPQAFATCTPVTAQMSFYACDLHPHRYANEFGCCDVHARSMAQISLLCYDTYAG